MRSKQLIKTVQILLHESTNALQSANVESARLDSLVLFEDVTGKNRAWILAHPEHQLSSEQTSHFSQLIERRIKHEPLAYIRGKCEFYGREFAVDKHVLIPRPESEAMIELLDNYLSSNNGVGAALDVGTGSGCLAITIKAEHPDIDVLGIDISPDALHVARQNARRHSAQIKWIQRDIANENLPAFSPTKPYVVLANLPYVPDGLVTSPEITREPPIALFSGPNGLDHYRSFFKRIGGLTHRPDALLTESLDDQHHHLVGMARQQGYQLAQTVGLVQLFVHTDNL